MGSLVNPYSFAAPMVLSGPHPYWRILITTNNGDATFVGVGKLEMYTGYGRVDQCVGGTPIGSGPGQFGNTLIAAFDEAADTQWAENKTGNDWIGYQFASPVEIRGIHMRDKGASQNALMPQNFQVQCSDDGSTWSTRWTVTGANFVTGGNWNGKWFWDPGWAPAGYTGSPIAPARYWRFRCFYHTADTFSCAELYMPIVPAGASVTAGGVALADDQSFGAASNAFDGNISNFWAPGNVAGRYIGYDFGVGITKAIAEMRWKSRSAGVPGQNPVRGVIGFSSDNVKWHSAWEAYDGVTWTDGMLKTFTDPLYV